MLEQRQDPGARPLLLTGEQGACAAWIAFLYRLLKDELQGAVVIVCGEEGTQVVAHGPPANTEADPALLGAASRALRSRRSLVAKRVVPGGHRGSTTCDISVPIISGGRVLGAAALRLAARNDPRRARIVAQLERSVGWLAMLLEDEPGAAPAETFMEPLREADRDHPSSSPSAIKEVLDLVATVGAQDRAQAAASALATGLEILLCCDRVSLALVRKDRPELMAMSHGSRPDRRAALVRAIEGAMEEALDQEESVSFPARGGTDGLRFQVTRMHAELTRRHGSGCVCSIPFAAGEGSLGVVTLERRETRLFDARTIGTCRAAVGLAGPLLRLKRRDERPLHAIALASLGDSISRLIGPGHPRWKAACLGIAGVAAFLCAATGDYRITAKCTLEGLVQRAAVAPFDGYVAEAPHRAGDFVRAGDLLCRLEDRDLALELRKWQGQYEQVSKLCNQALAQRNAAQVKILSAQKKQAEAQLALTQDRLSRTRILSPADGVVVAGDLSQSVGAPVERGDVLFEIAPEDSYRVVLEVDERFLSEVATGQRGQLVLAAFSGEPVPFKVERITPVAAASEGRNLFRVEAALERQADSRLRPGMQGVGKIEVERRLLASIWFGGALDWLRWTLWSWWP